MADEIVVYSTVWCPDCKRAKKFFSDHRIQYQNIDIEKDAEAMAFVEKVNNGNRTIPTIIFPDGSKLVEPSNAELAEKLGIKTKADHESYDVIIVGAGPTGLTASIYLAREGYHVLVIEKGSIGGQIGTTQMLDNFPGFDDGIGGEELAERLGRQAQRFEVEVLEAQEVSGIQQEGMFCIVETADGSAYTSHAVLLATGARYRRLEIPGEEKLIGTNVHFCATCDGAFYKGKKLLVIGGGNSAFEEGLFLTRFASQVDIVVNGDKVKASQILQEKVASKKSMSVTVNHMVEEFKGKNRLDSVIVKDKNTGELEEWDYDGVFVFVGLTPNNELVEDMVDVDRRGFICTDKTLMTSMNGVFAAGDVRAGSTKQAASAAGEGATAALMIRQYLQERG